MNLEQITALIDGKVICGEKHLTYQVKHAFSSDLLSDVLTVQQENTLLITGLSNIQTIRTADVVEIKAIIIARNKKVTQEMRNLACENDMIIVETAYSVFRVSGILFGAGLKPIY